METNLCVIYKYFQDFLVKMFSASYYVNKQAHIRFLEQINKKHSIIYTQLSYSLTKPTLQ